MSDTLEKKDVVLLDGGTGMSLVEMGHPELDTDPLWSAVIVKTHPEDLVKVHKEFFLSGSEVVVSATYQASVDGYMSRFKVNKNEAEELVRKSVTLAKEARDQTESITGHRGYVAASIGPYGAVLGDRSEYHGKYADNMTKEELSSWHLPRMQQISSTNPDLLAIETIPSVKEAEAILDNLTHFPNVKAWLTFQCKDGHYTAHGESIQEALRVATSNPHIVAVGVNCVNPCHVTSLIQSMAQVDLSIPIIAKPNSGQFVEGKNSDKYKTCITEMVDGWITEGATWIGGCCFINPSDIREIRLKLEANPSIRLVSLSKALGL